MPTSLDKLIKPEDRMERLVEAFVGHPGGPTFRAELDRVDHLLEEDLKAQQARFDAYEPPHSGVHDAQCQKVRYDEKHCCTCKENSDRRQAQVKAAALAGDMAFRDTLGGYESHRFDLIRKGSIS